MNNDRYERYVKEFKNVEMQNSLKLYEVASRKREMFLRKYPLSTLKNLPMKDYLFEKTGYGSGDTFCNWIYSKLNDISSSGNFRTHFFGIYYRNGNELTLSKTFQNMFFDDYESAYIEIRTQIVELLEEVSKNHYDVVEKCRLARPFKYKLLVVYFPEKFLPICVKSMMKEACNAMDIALQPNKELIYYNIMLRNIKESHNSTCDWDNETFLGFCRWVEKQKRFMNGVINKESDIEIESIFSEKKHIQIDYHINIFMKKLQIYQSKEKKLELLRQQFVSDYNMQKLMNMTKEEYVVGLKPDSFCNRLETQLKDLGDIHGSSATKFGLYYGKYGDDKEKRYRTAKKFSTDIEEAFIRIKEQIRLLIINGENNNIEAIKDSSLSPMFRGKILSTFFPNDYLGIFAEEHLDHFLDKLDLKIESDDVLDKQKRLLEWKKSREEFKGLSNYIFICFLYDSFGKPFVDKKDNIKKQSERDKEYPRDYVTKMNIKINEWKKLLQNSDIFKEKDIELLKRFYVSDNHAMTCYDLAVQDGVSTTSYASPIVALAKRISDELNLDPVYGTDGKRVWWRIVFWGRYREDNHFEWKLQPKLAKAISELYPELVVEEINDVEDEKLVKDLKAASLSEVDFAYEYKGQFKKKPAPIHINGHKTFPRDRQISVNALAHANYRCEIDERHPTFIRKNSDKYYTEPHHLIPMAFSDDFEVSLDVEENIVSLCSNCHNQIHYGKDAGELISKLYKDRDRWLKKVGIDVTEEELLKFYGF